MLAKKPVKSILKNPVKKRSNKPQSQGKNDKASNAKSKSDEKAVKKGKNVKPDKEKITKRERRSLKIDAKKHSEVVRFLLSKWELLRRDDTSKEKKHELIEAMLNQCQKVLADLCFAQDTSRIIESMIQFGTERHLYEIFASLKPKLMEMSESHFGKHVVKKLVSYCSKDQVAEIIKMVSGKVAKMLSHTYPCEIIELLFNDHANAKQRCQLLQELYGNRDLLGLTDDTRGTLADAIEMNRDKKNIILANLNSVLIKMVSKNLMNMSIIQHLTLEYIAAEVPSLSPMLYSSKKDEKLAFPEDFKLLDRLQLLIDAFVEHSQIVPMLHTREGVRVALCLLWLSNPKTKKGLLKSLKTAVASIAMNEHGYLFVIGLLDFVDDIVLLEKTVIKELLEDLEVIVTHPFGRKVLLYALDPRDTLHFTAQLVESMLQPGDLSPFTKKSLGCRAFELRSLSVGLLPALLRLAASKLDTLFVGDRVEHFEPVLDRGRLVLLLEMVLQSSRRALTPQLCLARYSRSTEAKSAKLNEPTQAELDTLKSLRCDLLRAFVKLCLAPEFVPTGKSLPRHEDRDLVQQKRKKRALVLADEELLKRRKITVPAFSKSVRLDGDENADEEMDCGEKKPTTVVLTKEDETLLEMPWLERPESTSILTRMIGSCKSDESYELLDLVMELVPAQVLRQWTACNRTCFFLVKMFECDYKPMCDFIHKEVANPKLISSLRESTLPGAQVLLKKLS